MCDIGTVIQVVDFEPLPATGAPPAHEQPAKVPEPVQAGSAR